MKRLIPLLLIPIAQAAWVPYAASTLTDYEYLNTDITRHNNNGTVFVVWTRSTSATNQQTIDHREVHCASKMYRNFYELQIAHDGRDTLVYKNITEQWDFAVPDTAEYILIQTICNNYN